MTITDSEIIAELTASGAKLGAYFLIGEDICTTSSDGLISLLLIEDLPGEGDGEMHIACVEFLRRRGAQVFGSYDDYLNRPQQKQ